MPAKIALPTVWEGLRSLAVFGRNTERAIDASRRLDLFTVATAPDPALNRGLLIQVTDETGGEVPAFSDGTDWRRVTDRAIIS